MGMAQGANVDAADITQEPGSTAHQQYSSQFLTDVDQVLVDLGRVHRSPTYLLTYKSYFMILVYLCLPLSDNIFFLCDRHLKFTKMHCLGRQNKIAYC